MYYLEIEVAHAIGRFIRKRYPHQRKQRTALDGNLSRERVPGIIYSLYGAFVVFIVLQSAEDGFVCLEGVTF